MDGQDLRDRLATGEPVLMPGVWDAMSARLVHQAGHEVAFLSGYSVSATLLGLPDFGYLTQAEMAEVARRVCRAAPGLMVVVDADTGYGNPLNTVRTVELWEAAGAAGLFLEDQVWPKKCGHMAGKQVVPAGDWLAKLAAAHPRPHRRPGGGGPRRGHRPRSAGARPGGRRRLRRGPGVGRRAGADRRRPARLRPRRQHDRVGQDPAAQPGGAARPRVRPDRLASERVVLGRRR
jgi:hypothetical protein